MPHTSSSTAPKERATGFTWSSFPPSCNDETLTRFRPDRGVIANVDLRPERGVPAFATADLRLDLGVSTPDLRGVESPKADFRLMPCHQMRSVGRLKEKHEQNGNGGWEGKRVRMHLHGSEFLMGGEFFSRTIQLVEIFDP